MSDTNLNSQLTQFERLEHIFPTLNAAHIARISARGKKREVPAGDVLVEPGDNNYQQIIDHVGGLKPGETKSIPPWPDQAPKRSDKPAESPPGA